MMVSGGEINSMITRVTTSLTTLPMIMGIIASRPWTWLISEIDRETTWPVRISSWPGPSRRCRVPRTCRRMSCCTPMLNRPAVYRRPNWVA